MASPASLLRLPIVAGCAWAGGLAGAGYLRGAVVLGCVVALLTCWLATPKLGLPLLAVGLVVAGTVAGSAYLRDEAMTSSDIPALATQRMAGTAALEVRGDPRQISPTTQVVRVVVTEFRPTRRAKGGVRTRVPAVLWAPTRWPVLALGETWEVPVRLGATGEEVSLVPIGAPKRLAVSDWVWRVAARARSGVQTAARAPHTAPPASASAFVIGPALVPALVDGDDSALPNEIVSDFKTAGLTHLLAVSGTNLTILLAFLVIAARWCGIRRRWLVVVGLVGVVGFVLLARDEPSVLRAAVMGTVGVLALGQRSPQRSIAVLSSCVVVLLLVQPGLAVQAGFALSVAATAGIVWWAPGWQEILAAQLAQLPGARWTAWLPVALAVPLAAQIACTPIVAALSGQVSLVSLIANMVVAPVVAPITLLGLAGGLVALVWEPLGMAVALPAGWGAAWIVVVARQCASVPGAATPWGTSPLALTVLTLVCLALVWIVPWLLRRPRWAALVLVTGLVVVLTPLPTPGWPPRGWLVAACDVGQGDALLLNAGNGQAVMVDVGPEPRAARRCLDRFDVEAVPLLILTHFDADHVAGLAGVVADVAHVETAIVALPRAGALAVRQLAGDRSRPARLGTRQVGEVRIQVLSVAPRAANPNDASVVVVAEVGGARVLLTGDLGAEAQTPIKRMLGDSRVDVLKVPHHGSKDTDVGWLRGMRPSVALISVGADNTYGHPADEVLAALAGSQIGRTDRFGDIAVVGRAGRWIALTS